MPSLDEHHSSKIVKILVVGDSGAGKTGCIAALIDAGYNVRIMDFEDKLDVLLGYVKDKSKLKNVRYETLKDQYKIAGTTLMISRAPSFQRGMALLNKWDDLGPISEWTEKDVLVIDALSSCGRASLNMVLQANGFTAKAAEIQHWGVAMENIEKLLDNLANKDLVPCHVVVLTHLDYREDSNGAITKVLPEALGKKLNPKVARRFNNMISLSLTGGERSFKVKRDGLLALKTSKPLSKDKYPIETGLADIFRELTK